MKAIKVILLILALAVTMPITLLVWIPLLIRMITLIAFASVVSAYTGKSLSGVQEGLEHAIDLPKSILQNVVSSVFEIDVDRNVPEDRKPLSQSSFLQEAVFTLIFWVSTVLLLITVGPWEGSGLLGKFLDQSSSQKNTLLTFKKDASIEFQNVNSRGVFDKEYYKSRFRIIPNSIAINPESDSYDFYATLCQLENHSGSHIKRFRIWYADLENGPAIEWVFESREPLYFLSNECKPIILLAESTDEIPKAFSQPKLGMLRFSLGSGKSFGSLDLTSLEDQGVVHRMEIRDEKNKPSS